MPSPTPETLARLRAQVVEARDHKVSFYCVDLGLLAWLLGAEAEPGPPVRDAWVVYNAGPRLCVEYADGTSGHYQVPDLLAAARLGRAILSGEAPR